MGSAVIAICDCGVNEEILIGGGMMNFTTTCYFPCCCENCNEVVQVNLLSKKMRCPKCRSQKVTPCDDPKIVDKLGNKTIAEWNMQGKIGRELILSDGSYWCPKCKKPNLRFEDGGMCWD